MEHEAHISATEAARTFSALLSRVQYRGETFIVDRAGRPACRIEPAGAPRRTVSDLVRLLRAAPRPDDEYFSELERLARRQPPLQKTPWRR